jgi:hypothetical protein
LILFTAFPLDKKSPEYHKVLITRLSVLVSLCPEFFVPY